jgi:hypothetical protein
MDDRSYTISVPRRWLRIALIVGATALVIAPLTAVATNAFTDVPNDHTHHNDITWLKDAGVTLGCNPPANDRYCPGDFVTRGQMASFMERLATNQVVDAGSVNEVEIHRFFHQVPQGTSDSQIGTFGPITLYGTCSAGNVPTLRASWNERVNHLTFDGANDGTLFGNASVTAGTVIDIGSGQFGSVGSAHAVGFNSHVHTAVDYFMRRVAALGDDACFFSGFVTIG